MQILLGKDNDGPSVLVANHEAASNGAAVQRISPNFVQLGQFDNWVFRPGLQLSVQLHESTRSDQLMVPVPLNSSRISGRPDVTTGCSDASFRLPFGSLCNTADLLSFVIFGSTFLLLVQHTLAPGVPLFLLQNGMADAFLGRSPPDRRTSAELGQAAVPAGRQWF